MEKLTQFSCLLLCVAVALGATDVSWCESDDHNAENEVDVGSCEEPPCKLHLGTTASIQIKFTPQVDVQSLTNVVKAKIFFVPLPFFGVDGTDACKNIYTLDGEANGCPLSKGQTYLYKNEFPVLRSYPRLSVTVQWALRYDSYDVVCFAVPAKLMY